MVPEPWDQRTGDIRAVNHFVLAQILLLGDQDYQYSSPSNLLRHHTGTIQSLD